MKTKIFISFIAVIFLAAGLMVFAEEIFAQEIDNIQYPVAELGNCENKDVCKLYCDKPENVKVCVNFAEKNNLMPKEEIDMAKKFIAAGSKGPGGCKTKDTCEEYCNNISNIDECIAFAEKNDLLAPKELEEAKKVQAAIAKGINPPPCGNKKSCDAYCENQEHMEECITFAEAAGFLQGKELEDAQKMLSALKRGIKAPPCKGKDECDEYCSNPDNMELCMNFAMEAGFMEEQEKTDAQKMLQALKKGIKPPKCKNKEDCDVYCSQDEHFEECTNFAEAAGFMTAEEAEMARKTGGKGPGGCKGKDECEAFCNNPDNQETCFNFAKENGLISEQDLKQIEQGKQKFKESLDQAPSSVIECLNSEIGVDVMEKLKSGSAMPSQEIGDKMRVCFEKMGQPQEMGGPGEGGMMPPAGQTGPGNCKTAEECSAYCETHIEECANFQPAPAGEGTPGNYSPQGMPTGPKGCQSPEECAAYCTSNPNECQNFSAPTQGTPGPNETNPNMPAPGGGGTQGMENPPCPDGNCYGPSFGQPGEQPGNQPGKQPNQFGQFPANYPSQEQMQQIPQIIQQEMQNLMPPMPPMEQQPQQQPQPQPEQPQLPAENPATAPQ
jgi:hypothetical protein